MLELFSRVRRSLLFFNLQVAEVTYFVAKLSDPAIEFCNSKRVRAKLDAGHAGTIRQRHANNDNSFFRFRV
jgi:hypothetical protein